jgi:hypothetical protein
MRCEKAIPALAVLGLASGLLHAQTPTALIKEGDTIVGMGALEIINYLAMNDAKTWCAGVVTSFPDTIRDGALLRSGFVTLRENMLLPFPIGAVLDDFSSVSFNNSGEIGMIVKAKVGDNAPQDMLYYNLVPIAKQGATTGPWLPIELVTGPGIGANSPWVLISVAKLNANNELFVSGQINNTSVTGPREDILIRYRLTDQGTIAEQTILGTKNMFLESIQAPIDTIGKGEHLMAINNVGDILCLVNATGNRGIMLNMDQFVAQEGRLSPVGRNWTTLQLAKVAINDNRDTVVTGTLQAQESNDPTVFLISKNGEKFAQSNDVIPTISASPIGKGSTAPIWISNAGDVFWRCAAGSEDAFCRNYEPIIQRNRTVINGNLVTSVIADDHSFAISPDGRFMIGRVELQAVGAAVLFADFGLIKELPGCANNPGHLSKISGEARLGTTFTLGLDDGPVTGALSFIAFARQPARPDSTCGINTVYGELLISAQVFRTFTLAPWNGTGPSTLSVTVPNTISLVDAVFYGQGVFSDPAHPVDFRLTNAVKIEIGAP